MSGRFVAFYLHRLYNGGIERVVFNLASEFIERGIRVDLVVNDAGWTSMARQIPAGVRLVDLKAMRIVDRPLKLSRYLRQELPSVLLASQHFSNEIAVLSSWLAGGKTSVIVWEHTTLSAELKASHPMHPRRWLLPAAAWLAFRSASRIVAVSEGVRADLVKVIRIAPSAVTAIYNPVFTVDLIAKSREPMHHAWFAPGEPPVIMGMGRLEKPKDFLNLLEAFSLVRANGPARLMLLGEGSMREELISRIQALGLSEDVYMPGFIENPFAYLGRAKVFVLSSAWEGFANVLVEAMVLGIPVVSTNCPSGPWEVLDGGRFGTLVPVSRPDLLGSAIVDVLNGKTRTEVATDWLTQFTPKAVADRFLEIMALPANS